MRWVLAPTYLQLRPHEEDSYSSCGSEIVSYANRVYGPCMNLEELEMNWTMYFTATT